MADGDRPLVPIDEGARRADGTAPRRNFADRGPRRWRFVPYDHQRMREYEPRHHDLAVSAGRVRRYGADEDIEFRRVTDFPRPDWMREELRDYTAARSTSPTFPESERRMAINWAAYIGMSDPQPRNFDLSRRLQENYLSYEPDGNYGHIQHIHPEFWQPFEEYMNSLRRGTYDLTEPGVPHDQHIAPHQPFDVDLTAPHDLDLLRPPAITVDAQANAVKFRIAFADDAVLDSEGPRPTHLEEHGIQVNANLCSIL